MCISSEVRAQSPADSIAALMADTLGSVSTLTDSLPPITPTDSVQKDTVMLTAPRKGALDDKVDYAAKDSIVIFGNGTAMLFGQGDVTYKTINLKADYMRVKLDSSTVYAAGVRDSVGDLQGIPKFSDNGQEYESNELTYNLKTKRGFIRHAVTQQGDGYVISEQTKRNNDGILTMAQGKYTTCDDHDDPHFYLALTKAKVKPGKYIATGPAYMVLADVPLPLAIPFGYFPFTNSYSSGVVIPSFDDNSQRGLGLRNGGYYFAINDYVDLELLGEIYTNRTWGITAQSKYVRRYKYSGNFNFTYRNDKVSEKDLPDYTEMTNMSIRWSHRQDAKASPYSTFSASVDFSTSGYNRSNINYYNDPNLTSQNTKSSSVSFSQRFPNSPFSITATAQVTQRSRDSTINLMLPSVNISMSSIYPFKRKNAVGKDRWYEKISMNYSGVLSNSIETKEDRILQANFFREWKNGMRHSIPLSASFNLFKYISISPSINLTDRMYFKSVEQQWDSVTNTVVSSDHYGFYNVFDFSLSVSASTKLYGFYIPVRKIFGDKIDRIRHVITPQIGFSYNPDFGSDFWGYYSSYVNNIGQTVSYSRFQNSLYGSPGQGKNGSITYSLANNLEMKVRNDNDTTGKAPFKIISLIDKLSISGNYNLMADSMNWSNIGVELRIKLWKSYSLNLNTSLDPYLYELNANGQPVHVNKLRWNHGKFPRWNGTSISVP
ncbi:MAG: LPS-assembly protein LptD, partial [Paludibacteraceae bacterium]|nr:LPS-assembly protein LptD [Paludibacteraceae bacterium]